MTSENTWGDSGPDSVDSREMLGLHTRFADLVVVGITAVMFGGIHLSGVGPGQFVLHGALALCISASILVVFRVRGAKLPVWAAALATGLIGVGAVGAALLAGPHPEPVMLVWTGTGWIIAQTFMAARGRQWWAISSVVLMAAITTGGVLLWGGDPGPVMATHLGKVPLLLMSSVFGLAINRRARDVMALRARSREKTAEGATAAATLAARDERLGWIRATVGPMMELIASGHRFTDDDQLDALVLEAHVRDTIRAPGLIGPPLDAAVEAARRRGVVVNLLDDGGARDLDHAASQRIREIAAERSADAVAPGRVVVRVLPPGRDEVLSFAGDASPGRRSYTVADLFGGDLSG